MIFDGKCTTRNEKRNWDDVMHSGFVGVLPARDENVFEMNKSTLD